MNLTLPFNQETNPANYAEYVRMFNWLDANGVQYEFTWRDTGKRLPSHVELHADQDALAFKLQFLL